MTPRDVIMKNLSGMVDYRRRYKTALPDALSSWYCYTIDGGHSIMAILRQHFQPGMGLAEAGRYMLPAPVKTVLHSYVVCDGIVVLDIPAVDDLGDELEEPYYSPFLGLVCPEEDYEYGD